MADDALPVPHIWIPGIDELKAHTERNYGDAKHERKPHGTIFVNGMQVADTLQCPHCMMHFVSVKSGPRRKCAKCDDIVCNKPECLVCTPWVAELGMSQGRVL